MVHCVSGLSVRRSDRVCRVLSYFQHVHEIVKLVFQYNQNRQIRSSSLIGFLSVVSDPPPEIDTRERQSFLQTFCFNQSNWLEPFFFSQTRQTNRGGSFSIESTKSLESLTLLCLFFLFHTVSTRDRSRDGRINLRDNRKQQRRLRGEK